MDYLTDNDRWLAFKTNDPFAISAFFICNPLTHTVCRPNCDAHNVNVKRSDIVFTEDIDSALADNYVPCVHSLPEYAPNYTLLRNYSFSAIDVALLRETVKNVNNRIGFDNQEDHSRKLCCKDNYPNGDDLNNSSELTNEPKIDDLRFNLIVTACRHLALAALASFSDISISDQVGQSFASETDKVKRGSFTMNTVTEKRRKGGVLGFKELAQKCNMSAWHFHRVFKSIAGVTPKAYGDECAKYIKEHSKSQKENFLSGDAIIISTIVSGREESQQKPLKEHTSHIDEYDDDNNLHSHVPSPKRKQLSACSSSCKLDSLSSVVRRNTVPALAHGLVSRPTEPTLPLKQSYSTYSLHDSTAELAFQYNEDIQDFKNTNPHLVNNSDSVFASFEGAKANYGNGIFNSTDVTPPTTTTSITNFSNESSIFEPPFTDLLDPLMMTGNDLFSREYLQQRPDYIESPVYLPAQPPTLNETFLLNQLRRHSELEKLDRLRSVEYSANSNDFDDILFTDALNRNENHLDI